MVNGAAGYVMIKVLKVRVLYLGVMVKLSCTQNALTLDRGGDLTLIFDSSNQRGITVHYLFLLGPTVTLTDTN